MTNDATSDPMAGYGMLTPYTSYIVIMSGAGLSAISGLLTLAEAAPVASSMGAGGWAGLVGGVLIAAFGYAGKRIDLQFKAEMVNLKADNRLLSQERASLTREVSAHAAAIVELKSSKKEYRAFVHKSLSDREDRERYIVKLECQLGIVPDDSHRHRPTRTPRGFKVVADDDPSPDESDPDDDFSYPSATPPPVSRRKSGDEDPDRPA